MRSLRDIFNRPIYTKITRDGQPPVVELDVDAMTIRRKIQESDRRWRNAEYQSILTAFLPFTRRFFGMGVLLASVGFAI